MSHAQPKRKLLARPDLSLALIGALIALLWLAGGASRGDVMGQVVIRAGSWAIFIATMLFGSRPDFATVRVPLLLCGVAVLLPALQLIPLPPNWWLELPGRRILLVPGEPVPWRPLTMTPGATRNALSSMVVPLTMLVLLAQAGEHVHRWVLAILLSMITAAVFVGLLQFSGSWFNNPLLNDTPGKVSSIFANRNHFALLVAMGCLIAPVWAFIERDGLHWRGPLSAGLVLLFVLTILATGSRSGMLLGVASLSLSVFLIGRPVRRRLKAAPKWVLPTSILVTAVAVGGLAVLTFAADRADAIDRLIALDPGDDMRSRALPTVISMITTYMPFGSGFGGFDTIFRIHEPFALLKFTYFNEAHNDYLGVALDGGVPGIALLLAACLWWIVSTVRCWRLKPDDTVSLGRLGSSMIFLVLVASVTDYPARTPTIMAILVIAAVWLARADPGKTNAALPA